ncbi:MAG: type II secretion system protein [bacterium]
MKNRKSKGFTLIELMIIVAVLSILVAIALPRFSKVVQRAQEGRIKGNLASFRAALDIYYGDNDGYWPHSNKTESIASGSGMEFPSDWSFFSPEYIDEIPPVFTGQGDVWGNHEGRNRICVAWARGDASPAVVPDAIAGTAHHENAYEYLYYVAQSPSDGTGGYAGHIWINCELTSTKGDKIISW